MTQEEKDALQKIEEFLDSNNIDIEYEDGEDNYIDIAEDRIVVSRRQSTRHIIYTILHEIGHYFSEFHPEEENEITQVIEEVLAWDTGRDVAYSLGIDIDDKRWNGLMISSIRKYIEK